MPTQPTMAEIQSAVSRIVARIFVRLHSFWQLVMSLFLSVSGSPPGQGEPGRSESGCMIGESRALEADRKWNQRSIVVELPGRRRLLFDSAGSEAADDKFLADDEHRSNRDAAHDGQSSEPTPEFLMFGQE
jgi:hypothetical protein